MERASRWGAMVDVTSVSGFASSRLCRSVTGPGARQGEEGGAAVLALPGARSPVSVLRQ